MVNRLAVVGTIVLIGHALIMQIMVLNKEIPVVIHIIVSLWDQ